MAGRKRPTGTGMAPLFDIEAVERRDEQAEAKASRPVNYWVRGRFHSGGGEQTHTVRAVGMSEHLDADVAKFVRYLTEEGFQFADGRAVLIELLGVGADDGAQIALSSGQE